MKSLSKKFKGNSSKIFESIVETLPLSVMRCDLEDFKIVYINKSTIENLKKIEHVLPCKAEDIMGQSIDIFHKNPQHQREMLKNPNNLLTQRKLKLAVNI